MGGAAGTCGGVNRSKDDLLRRVVLFYREELSSFQIGREVLFLSSSALTGLHSVAFDGDCASMDRRTPALGVQITQIDYSLDAPDSLDNSNLPKVPVLRLYGASSAGKKCCLHIHQVYPYFFVEYTGKMNPGSGEQ
jgi:hypothetical protein